MVSRSVAKQDLELMAAVTQGQSRKRFRNRDAPDGVCHCLMRNSLLYSDNVRQSAVQTISALFRMTGETRILVNKNIDSMERGRRFLSIIQGG